MEYRNAWEDGMGDDDPDSRDYRSPDPQLGDREALKRLVEAATKIPMTEATIRRSGFADRVFHALASAGFVGLSRIFYITWKRRVQPGLPYPGSLSPWTAFCITVASAMVVAAIVFLLTRWRQRVVLRRAAERPAEVLCGHYEKRMADAKERTEGVLFPIAINLRPAPSQAESPRRDALRQALLPHYIHLAYLIA